MSSAAPRGRAALLLLLCAIPMGLGCVAVRPLETARREAEGLFLEAGGQRIHAVVEGRGEPVMLLHGFGGSTYSWRHIQPALAEEHRAIALDLTGFGYSERPAEPARYSRAAQVNLVLAAMDALGVESAHLVGHSYGGGLAMTLAAWHPERVRSLVLIDSTAPDYAQRRRRPVVGLPPVSWLWVRALALRRGFVRHALERAYADDSLVTDDVLEEYLERLRVEGVARAYRGLTARLPEAEEGPEVRYEDLRSPTLVIWGGEDPLIPAAAGRRATRDIPDCRFVEIAGVGHAPMEEAPREVLAVLLPFLRQFDAE